MRHEMRDTRCEIRNRGFTLTEVIIASALLIVAVVPILKALTSAHVTGTIIERRTRSLTLAQAKLDDIRVRLVSEWGQPNSFDENNTSLDGPYLCDVQDTRVSGDLRSITVSVGYDKNGNSNLAPGEIEVTLATLVARRS
jgi:prepilin-type N-terminal cleavage/methylation domain-containing protein